MAPSQVLPHALDLPIFRFLKDKRVVLASASPRRKELLETSVSNAEGALNAIPMDVF
jgi:septum formation protein